MLNNASFTDFFSVCAEITGFISWLHLFLCSVGLDDCWLKRYFLILMPLVNSLYALSDVLNSILFCTFNSNLQMAAGCICWFSEEDTDICELCIYNVGPELFSSRFHGQFLYVHCFRSILGIVFNSGVLVHPVSLDFILWLARNIIYRRTLLFSRLNL